MYALDPIIDKIGHSPTLKINERVSELKRKGERVLHFGFGQSPFDVHKSIIEALRENAHRKTYLPCQGLAELREAVRKYHIARYNQTYDADRIVIGPGSKELIFGVLFVVEGDILIPTPGWVSYSPMSWLARKKVIKLPTTYETRYQVTAEQLDKRIHEAKSWGYNPRLLILNSPGNPTGLLYSEQSLIEIAEVARKHHIIILCDEIYAQTTYDWESFRSMVHYYPEATIVTSGLSKDRSAGGYRLGVGLFPKSLGHFKDAAIKLASETFSCVATPIQYAAIKAYDLENKELFDYVALCRSIIGLTEEYAFEKLKAAGLLIHSPQGAFYQYPNFEPFADKLQQRGIRDSLTLSEHLLSEYRVATLPATSFLDDTNRYALRFAFVDFTGDDVVKEYRKVKESGTFNSEAFIQKSMPHVIEGLKRVQQFISEI